MTEFRDKVIAHLVEEEGVRTHAYLDSLGVTTIGVGRNIDEKANGPGLSVSEINFMLGNDIDKCIKDLRAIIEGFDGLSDGRRLALISMRFQLGLAGFLSFKQTIAHVNKGEFLQAARQMLKSRAAQQTPRRWKRLSTLMEIEDAI